MVTPSPSVSASPTAHPLINLHHPPSLLGWLHHLSTPELVLGAVALVVLAVVLYLVSNRESQVERFQRHKLHAEMEDFYTDHRQYDSPMARRLRREQQALERGIAAGRAASDAANNAYLAAAAEEEKAQARAAREAAGRAQLRALDQAEIERTARAAAAEAKPKPRLKPPIDTRSR